MVSCYTGDAMNDAMNEWMDKQRFIKNRINFSLKKQKRQV